MQQRSVLGILFRNSLLQTVLQFCLVLLNAESGCPFSRVPQTSRRDFICLRGSAAARCGPRQS